MLMYACQAEASESHWRRNLALPTVAGWEVDHEKPFLGALSRKRNKRTARNESVGVNYKQNTCVANC